MSQKGYDERIATIDERIEQLRARRRDEVARRETGERKARNHVCHAVGEAVLAAYGAEWRTLDFNRLGDLIRTEIPARRTELTVAGGRATTEDALGRLRSYERGRTLAVETPVDSNAGADDVGGWE